MPTYTDVISSYLLFLGSATALLLIWVTRQQRTHRDAATWLISSLTGVVLGGAGAAALLHVTGHHVAKNEPPVPAVSVPAASSGPSMQAQAAASHGGPGGGMGGGMMGMGGGGRGPSPKRQLTTLVRKLELLTGDIALTLTDEQKKVIAGQLTALADAKTLTDEEAEQQYNALLDVLDESQKAKQDAVGVPPRGGRPGGGMGGGAQQAPPDENPFTQAENAKALESLRGRLQ